MSLFESKEEKKVKVDLIIGSRELGPTTHLSVGTAMVFDNEEVKPEEWEAFFYVNLRTLYRNFIQAIPAEKFDELEAEYILEPFLEEMDTLKETVKSLSGDKTQVVYYLPDYSGIKRFLPQHITRMLKTEKQFKYKKLEDDFFDILEDEQDKRMKEEKERKPDKKPEPMYIECDCKLPKGKGPAVILTHFPTDLLSASQFPSLKLIESHTGKIKKRKDWASKLTGKPELLDRIPFCRFTLQICGDGNNLVSSAGIKLKQYLERLAVQNEWSNTTTEDRVRFCVNRVKNLKDKTILRSFL